MFHALTTFRFADNPQTLRPQRSMKILKLSESWELEVYPHRLSVVYKC